MSGRTRAPAHHRRHHARRRDDTRNPHTTYVTSLVVLATSHVSVRTAASGCLRPHSFTDAPPPSLATASLAAATGLLFVVIRQRALLLHQGDDVGDERRKRQMHHLAPAPLRDPIRRLDRVCYHNLHVTVGGRWVGVDDTHGGGVRGGLDIKRSEEIDVVGCCEGIPTAHTHRRHSKTQCPPRVKPYPHPCPPPCTLFSLTPSPFCDHTHCPLPFPSLSLAPPPLPLPPALYIHHPNPPPTTNLFNR